MILILSDRTQAITTTLDYDQAIQLLADLPAGITVRIRPEDPFRVRVPTSTRVQEPHPPGYFGLAVAQAYDTWGDGEAYQAYLRGEIPDPRD